MQLRPSFARTGIGKSKTPAGREKSPEIPKLIIRLLLNGIRFRYLHLTGRPGCPQAVSIEITHDCIARCMMCNIWKIPARKPNLPIADWLALLASPALADLRELDVTGGRYLNTDLANDLLFNAEDKSKMIRFFRRQTSGWSYHGQRLIDYFYTGCMQKPCTCGFNYFFVRRNGDL